MMAARAPPWLLCLCLCFASCLIRSKSDELEGRRQLAASGHGYRATAVMVDQERRRLAAELVPAAGAGAGGGSSAHGDDVQRLDVYASYLSFYTIQNWKTASDSEIGE
ncbi:hypothetical protein GUJ93_ZPchr0006g43161 [Zizania palustris]|uniref:Uncharacterized protein n=1 Tax=Zizania palustris TaxID=103762 RepID=A0A8J5SFG1_ZIZPA|nr:hypothetical protein GUJ93_ZPchr0006g43161 [Zizania palustris]